MSDFCRLEESGPEWVNVFIGKRELGCYPPKDAKEIAADINAEFETQNRVLKENAESLSKENGALAVKVQNMEQDIFNSGYQGAVLEAKLKEMRFVGGMMANLCFNGKQQDKIPDDYRERMKSLQEDWDKIIKSPPPASIVERSNDQIFMTEKGIFVNGAPAAEGEKPA